MKETDWETWLEERGASALLGDFWRWGPLVLHCEGSTWRCYSDCDQGRRTFSNPRAAASYYAALREADNARMQVVLLGLDDRALANGRAVRTREERAYAKEHGKDCK